MRVWDSEGNEFTIQGGHGNSITLKGQGGEKEIAASDLKFYRGYPPDVWDAMEKILQMVKEGKITQNDLERLKKEALYEKY